MRRVHVISSLISLLATTLLPACGAENTMLEDAFNWDVSVTLVEDLCNESAVPFNEKYTYSLVFKGSATALYIGDAPFAAGTITGCELEYEGPVIGEKRGAEDQFWIQYQLSGETVLREGGAACDLEVGVDWLGTETYEIVSSDDPGLEQGCTYSLAVEGKFNGQS